MEEPENPTLSQATPRPQRKPNLAYLESTLGYRMKRAQVELYRGIYESLGDTKLTLVQFSVLSIAQDNPGIAQSELATALGVERPRLVPIIDSLERLALAERRQNPEDRRGRMIFLTPAGQTCITRLKGRFDAHQSRLKSQMGDQMFEQLLDSLDWVSTHPVR